MENCTSKVKNERNLKTVLHKCKKPMWFCICQFLFWRIPTLTNWPHAFCKFMNRNAGQNSTSVHKSNVLAILSCLDAVLCDKNPSRLTSPLSSSGHQHFPYYTENISQLSRLHSLFISHPLYAWIRHIFQSQDYFPAWIPSFPSSFLCT